MPAELLGEFTESRRMQINRERAGQFELAAGPRPDRFRRRALLGGQCFLGQCGQARRLHVRHGFPFRSSARWAIASFVVACNANLQRLCNAKTNPILVSQFRSSHTLSARFFMRTSEAK